MGDKEQSNPQLQVNQCDTKHPRRKRRKGEVGMTRDTAFKNGICIDVGLSMEGYV